MLTLGAAIRDVNRKEGAPPLARYAALLQKRSCTKLLHTLYVVGYAAIAGIDYQYIHTCGYL